MCVCVELPQMTEEDVAAIQMSDSLRSAQEEVSARGLVLVEGAAATCYHVIPSIVDTCGGGDIISLKLHQVVR